MTEPFDSRLRDELVAAADRHRAHRAQRARLARVALLGVVVVVVGAALFAANGFVRSDKASAGVDIRVENGQLTVRLTDLESRPDVIRAALEKAGLPVTITAEPVGPSEVGRFLGDDAGGPAPPPELHELDAQNGACTRFVLPVGWPGHLTLIVGRPAALGETYFAPSNAFAVGEPLACTGVPGLRLADVAAHLPTGVNVRVLATDGTAVEPMVSLDVAVAAHADYRVATAAAFSPTDVVLTATPDGQPVLNAAPTSNAPC